MPQTDAASATSHLCASVPARVLKLIGPSTGRMRFLINSSQTNRVTPTFRKQAAGENPISRRWVSNGRWHWIPLLRPCHCRPTYQAEKLSKHAQASTMVASPLSHAPCRTWPKPIRGRLEPGSSTTPRAWYGFHQWQVGKPYQIRRIELAPTLKRPAGIPTYLYFRTMESQIL